MVQGEFLVLRVEMSRIRGSRGDEEGMEGSPMAGEAALVAGTYGA